MQNEEKLAYTRRELAKATGIGLNQILEEIHAGRLKAFRQGRKWVIPRKAAEAWLEQRLQADGNAIAQPKT